MITGVGSYDPSASSTNGTSKATTETVYVGSNPYLPYWWTGNFVTDTACFGGICVDKFNFFMANDTISGNPFTNVLGLGPDVSSNPNSLVKAMHKQNLVDKPIATVWLNSANFTAPGLFVIGDIIPDMKDSQFTKHKNINHGSNTYWQLKLTKFQIDGKDQTSSTTSAFVDPSSSMTVPYLDWPLYRSAIQAASSDFTCNSIQCTSSTSDCTKYLSALPTFNYFIESVSYTMPPQTYVFSNAATTTCEVQIFASPLYDIMQLGIPFAQ